MVDVVADPAQVLCDVSVVGSVEDGNGEISHSLNLASMIPTVVCWLVRDCS